MKINIEKLSFECVIGILPFERETAQKVIVDISFEYDFCDNAHIDYAAVCSEVENLMKNSKFELLETAVDDVCKKLNSIYEIQELFVKISKPDILPNCTVSVSNF